MAEAGSLASPACLAVWESGGLCVAGGGLGATWIKYWMGVGGQDKAGWISGVSVGGGAYRGKDATSRRGLEGVIAGADDGLAGERVGLADERTAPGVGGRRRSREAMSQPAANA
jgi:hypothetical protein